MKKKLEVNWIIREWPYWSWQPGTPSSDSSVDRWLGTLRSLLCRSFHPLLCPFGGKYRCRDYRSLPIVIRTVLLPLFQYQMNSTCKCRKFQPPPQGIVARYPGRDLDSRTKLPKRWAPYKEKRRQNVSALPSSWSRCRSWWPCSKRWAVAEFLKSRSLPGWTLVRSTRLISLPVLAALLHIFQQLVGPIKPCQSVTGSATPWCMWCLWMIFFFALFSASGSHSYWWLPMLTKSANPSLEQPLQDYRRAWSKRASFARHGKQKRRAPNKAQKKKIRKRWTYGPIYWSNLLKKRFKKVWTI